MKHAGVTSDHSPCTTPFSTPPVNWPSSVMAPAKGLTTTPFSAQLLATVNAVLAAAAAELVAASSPVQMSNIRPTIC